VRRRSGKHAVPALVVLGFAITLALRIPRRWGADTARAAATVKPTGPTSDPIKPWPGTAPSLNPAVAARPPDAPPARAAPISRAELQAPALPVRISFPFPLNSRDKGRTLVLLATSDEPLAVEVNISNSESGKQLEQAISLNPPKRVQLGRDEGFEPESGDRVVVHAVGHADLHALVP